MSFGRLNPLSANPTKWPNTLKQFVGKLPTNCLNLFGHFVNLVLKGLKFTPTLSVRTLNLNLTQNYTRWWRLAKFSQNREAKDSEENLSKNKLFLPRLETGIEILMIKLNNFNLEKMETKSKSILSHMNKKNFQS